MGTIVYNATPTGHYGFEDLAASSVGSYYLQNGSYNNITFAVTHIGIANVNNGVPVIVTFTDGSSYTVQPYVNALVDCKGRAGCTVSNSGLSSVRVTLMDNAHAQAYGSQYKMSPWELAPSVNEVLFHFTEAPIKNFGSDRLATFQLRAAETQALTGGKFQSSLINSGYIESTGALNSGLDITPSQSVSNTEPYTIDFWAQKTGTLGTTNNHFVTTPQVIWREDVQQWQFVGGLGIVTTLPAGWFHTAIVQEQGGVSTLYVNGAVMDTAGGSAFNTLVIQNSSVSTAITKAFPGKISEVRFRRGAVWTAPFTPPTSPYN